MHLNTVTEVLQSIRQAEMTPLLQRIYASEGGPEVCDTLMKYLYKGMSQGAPAGSRDHSRNVTPQATGFTQMAGRSFGGEGRHINGGVVWLFVHRVHVDGVRTVRLRENVSKRENGMCDQHKPWRI